MVIAKRDVDTELRLGRPGRGGASAAAEKWVKVSMQGVSYQRKVDLRAYRGYWEPRAALPALLPFVGTFDLAGKLGFTVTYEDEDGDLPWEDPLNSEYKDGYKHKCAEIKQQEEERFRAEVGEEGAAAVSFVLILWMI